MGFNFKKVGKTRKIRINEEQVKKVFGEEFDVNRGLYEPDYYVSYNNPISIYPFSSNVKLSEGLVKTYPFENLKKHFCSFLNVPTHYFHEYTQNGVKCAAIDVIDNEQTKGMVTKVMNTFGYFNSRNGLYDGFVRMHFELKFEEETIVEKFLYHITNHVNLPKIQKIGLFPSHKNTIFNYPNRIYFLKSDVSKEEIENVAKNARSSQKKDIDDGLYVILKIDLDKIPSGIKFYNDPNLKNSAYTTDNIPPSAIVDDIDYIYMLNNTK